MLMSPLFLLEFTPKIFLLETLLFSLSIEDFCGLLLIRLYTILKPKQTEQNSLSLYLNKNWYFQYIHSEPRRNGEHISICKTNHKVEYKKTKNLNHYT